MTNADPMTVTISGVDLFDAYLCLGYRVLPRPGQLAGDCETHEGEDAGVAIDGLHHVHGDFRSAYRVSVNGSCVVGALKIGPATWDELGSVAVMFSPFAHTPELRGHLCEVRLAIQHGDVQVLSVRAA